MKKWIYEIRGMAIFAVVICHMQGVLHSSEWVQMFTLYSVTSMIFLMGYTKWLVLSKLLLVKSSEGGNKKRGSEIVQAIKSNIGKSIWRVMPEYIIVCIVSLKSAADWNAVFIKVLTFENEMYFLKHYLILTIIAPLLFVSLIAINGRLKNNPTICMLMFILFDIVLFLIGYTMILVCDIFVQSYLAVYALGMMMACLVEKDEDSVPVLLRRNIFSFIISIAIFIFGLYEVHKFYFARVAGNYSYAEGIDHFTVRLQLNPPNLSVILYSMGCIAIFCFVFAFLNGLQNKLLKFILDAIALCGKYSLDIYLWHLIILRQICLPLWSSCGLTNIWIKRIGFYILLFGIPILGRYIVNQIKNKYVEVLEKQI